MGSDVMRALNSLLAGLVAAAACAVPASSQPTEDPAASRWYLGASIGIPGYKTEAAPWELFTLGFQASRGTLGRPGLDFAVGTMPRLIAALPIGVRGGLALPIGSADRVFWPSVGASLASASGSGGTGGLFGGYVGLGGTFFGADASTGVRTTVTVHRLDDLSTIWLFEVGFVNRR
jgi:opacity protein-like surface antigen